MDGNVDPEGIRRDLTWLHAAGVRGVQLFDGGMGMPLVVPEAVRPGTAAWDDAIEIAVTTAADLGMELAVATSSGWSAAGGPWVRPEDAMKKVVWSETVVEGGGPVEASLSPLPAVAGLFQDCPREGASAPAPFAQEWRVLAVPHRSGDEVLIPAAVTASAPLGDWTGLVDGSFYGGVTLPRDPDGWSQAWIEQRFDAPVTVRSLVVGLPGPRGFGAAPSPGAVLEVSDDGTNYLAVAHLDASTVPARSVSFPPVTGRRFRLRLSGAGAADSLPPLSPGVRLPPVLRRAHEFRVTEFALRADGRVHLAEVKAGFGVVADYYAVDTDPRSEHEPLHPSQVVDVTGQVEQGVLRWNAPAGRWLILRLGASLTGQTNGPAPDESTGLEVDKLDRRRVEEYLAAHLERFAGARGADGRFDALLSDSIESGPQNWTDRIREEFAARRGYDPVPWLPTLTGRLIGDVAASDGFLFDYRRTLAELLAEEYYGTLAAQARRRGMAYYAEALEDARPQLGDDLAMRAAADVPMGAMWTFDPAAGPRPTYVADLKGAASVAHVHGRRWVGSEAFTSFDDPWSWSPRTLKHIADLQLSLGVTRFCIHTSPHQPMTAPPPGIALAPFLGQSFTVAETWSGMARPWIDYLARCSAVLSAGSPAVDIAVFVGEEAPVTGLFHADLDRTVPEGYDFDYVGPAALAGVLRVEDGRLVSDGASYRMLHLAGSSRRLTVQTLEQLDRLAEAGAVIVGRRPEGSPSAGDDPARVREVVDRLWGRETVIDADLPTALRRLDVQPRTVIEGAAVRRIARIVDDALVVFVSNPTGEEVRLRLELPRAGAPVAWDPVQLTRTPLHSDDGASELVLAPFGSVFVVQEQPPVAPTHAPAPRRSERIPLDGAWRLRIDGRRHDLSPAPRPWTELGDAERGFSGTATYSHSFRLTAQTVALASADEGRAVLGLGAVADIARIALNGIDCGIVWTAPFEIDVTSAIRSGSNLLEVEVATPWRNRLIAEAASASGELFAPMTSVFEPSAPPIVAGLGGEGVVLHVRS
jgi:hypothetical protein